MPYTMNMRPKLVAGGMTVGQKLEYINAPWDEDASDWNPDDWEGYGEVIKVVGDDVIVQWHHDGTKEQIEGEELMDFMVDSFETDYWRKKLGRVVDDSKGA